MSKYSLFATFYDNDGGVIEQANVTIDARPGATRKQIEDEWLAWFRLRNVAPAIAADQEIFVREIS